MTAEKSDSNGDGAGAGEPLAEKFGDGSDTVASNGATDRPSLEKSSKEEKDDSIGHASGEYACSHNHINGILYAGSEGVTFKGTIFFYNSYIHHKWKDVKKVQQTELGHVSLLLTCGKETTFQWLDHSSDKVWATLVSLHHEYINGTPIKEPLLTPIRANLRRLSTDPTPTVGSSQATSGEEAAYVAAATVATMDDLRSLSARRLSIIPDNESSKQQAEDLTMDLEEAWRELHDDSKAHYAEVAVEVSGIYDMYALSVTN